MIYFLCGEGCWLVQCATERFSKTDLRPAAASVKFKQSDWVQDVVFKAACRDSSGQTCCFDPHNESLFTLRNYPSSWSSQNATCCCCGQINPPRIVPDPRWAWPLPGSLTHRWVLSHSSRSQLKHLKLHKLLMFLLNICYKPQTPGQILNFKSV